MASTAYSAFWMGWKRYSRNMAQPTTNPKCGFQLATDVGVHRTGGRIDARHAAEADGGDGHRNHGEQERRDGVAVRKNLAFTEKRDRGDGRSENDAVVDQVPQAQRALEMGLPG